MIDLTFVRAVESALVCAVTSTLLDDASPVRPGDLRAPQVRKLCKNAAQRLFFDLDGLALLDLGMNKLAAEQQGSRPIARFAPSHANDEAQDFSEHLRQSVLS